MKWILSRFYYYRYRRLIKQLESLTRSAMKHGTVRDIQFFAEQWKSIGERHELPEVVAMSDNWKASAEKVILRRVFPK